MITKTLLAAAVLAAVAASPAHADFRLNGFTLNGISVQGISIQGVSLQGLSIQGINLNGFGLDQEEGGLLLNDSIRPYAPFILANAQKRFELGTNTAVSLGGQAGITATSHVQEGGLAFCNFIYRDEEHGLKAVVGPYVATDSYYGEGDRLMRSVRARRTTWLADRLKSLDASDLDAIDAAIPALMKPVEIDA